ncbi:SKI family transcriptional corepressor 1 homolog-B [Anthonomus grandis grandis]|uniref:SKI family transcriptional corepressor 1 homolog-B n=1 Tax=Anthonomus grandis grandis TaxID=2921223 RepID=UPI002165D1F9|nr:SKI family transcriptional corepressor 1 homolog-B [Anthonomus grandis grandis]
MPHAPVREGRPRIDYVDQVLEEIENDPTTSARAIERRTGIPKSFQVSTVVLYGVPIVSLVIENQERLCLAQISNTLLKQFSYNEIHNRRVALGITCVQCTPVQLEILRRAGAMPVSSRRCGMITRREAERLCKSFLGDNAPPRLPEDFAFSVHHECAWGCRGSFLPSRYNSSRAKCIKCSICGLFFSPNKFIFHSHRLSANDKYVQPDAANFNSWRRHMKLSGNPHEEIIHAWEDVKAMFNGGTRKRLLSSSVVSTHTSKQNKVEPHIQPIVPSPRIAHCQDFPLPISRVALDLMCHKPLSFSSYSSLPWLKKNPVLFPPGNTFFSIDKSYQSAFKPVQPFAEDTEHSTQRSDDSDNEVDIETTDDNMGTPTKWELKDEKGFESPTSPTTSLLSQSGDEVPTSTKLWSFTKLQFDGIERSTFLSRPDLHRRFIIESSEENEALRSPVNMILSNKPSLDCSACSTSTHGGSVFSSTEEGNKVM